MAVARLNRPPRRGLTLVELLMVITIMAVLMVVAVPLVRPAFQDRNLREAARQVNVFLAGAQARAAELGRPVGVWIERTEDPLFASRLYMAEVAPSFTGGTLDSRATVVDLGGGLGQLQLALGDATILQTLVALGEKFTVQLDHQGPHYSGQRLGGNFQLQIPWGVPPGADSPPGLPFAITRGPVRSAVAPLTLPGDSVIDLSLSGIGSVGRELDSSLPAPIVILFAPSGRIDDVYKDNAAFRPFAPLHLLIGRRGKVVNPVAVDSSNAETTNLADPTNLWVTVSERTGAIYTSDNADTSHIPPSPPPPPYAPSPRLRDAREFARLGVQKGGR